MGKYTEMSKQVLANVGGVENISLVERCATRLRIRYIQKSNVDIEAIRNVENVVGVVEKSGQVQVVIGPEVNDAYHEFLDVSGWKPTGEESLVVDDEPETKDFMYWLNKLGNSCAAIFMPIIPALITGGLILAIKNLMVNYLGLGVDSGTAQVCLAFSARDFRCFPSGSVGRLPTNSRWNPLWAHSSVRFWSVGRSAALRVSTLWGSRFRP